MDPVAADQMAAKRRQPRAALAALAVSLVAGALAWEGVEAATEGKQEAALFAVGLQTDEPPLTKAERKEKKRAQAEEEARAKAAAKLEKQRLEQAREQEKERAKFDAKHKKQRLAQQKEQAKVDAQKEKQRLAEEKKRAKEEARLSKGRRADVRLQDLEIEEGDGQVGISLRTDKQPQWTATERPEGGIVLRLLNVDSKAGLAPLIAEQGIVTGVELTHGKEDGVATLEVEIATRVAVAYSVRPAENGLFLRLRPLPEEVASSPPSPAAAPVTMLSPTEFNTTLENAEYKVGAGDLLAIEVFGLPELTRSIRVDGIGTINFPILGTVEVVGLSLREAEAKLTDLLSARGLVNDPVVAMAVEELVSRGVSLQGAVSRPGLYQLLRPKSLIELLVENGGLEKGESAGRKIFVLRRTADGRQLRTEIDAERLLEQGDLTLNVMLQPGDIIQVPAPQRGRVYVSGAVRRPGPVEYLGNERMTLLQAVTTAGGPTERARLGQVQVIRRSEDGTEERFVIDLKKISKGKLEDFLLQRGDTVVLKEWFF